MRIAYSTLACPAWTVEQAADAARDNAFDGIEWRVADGALLSADTPSGVYERIAAASDGLAVACVDTSAAFVHPDDAGRDRAVAEAVAMARHAATLGAPSIRVYGGRLPDGTGHDQVLDDASASLGRAVDEAAALGVRVLIETHDDWSSSAQILRLAQASGAEVLWDVFHTFRAGEDPAETLDRLAGFVALVHVKDGLRTPDGSWTLTPLGDGELPLQAITEMLEDSGYDGFVSFEWEKHWHPSLADPQDVLPKAAEFLRGIAR